MHIKMANLYAAYVWVVLPYLLLKYNLVSLKIFKPMYNFIFLGFVVVIMAFANQQIMLDRCGMYSIGTIAYATLVPWVFMLGATLVVLEIMPGWKQPFANTFGYVFFKFAGGAPSVVYLLQPNLDSLKYITEDPSLLANKFTVSNFEEMFNSFITQNIFKGDGASEPFRNVVVLKDMASEFVWYILVGTVAITTSQSIILSYKCTLVKDPNAPEPEVVPETTTIYENTS